MDQVFECSALHHALALAIAASVFFIALFMAAKQWIGFSITSILLFFSLLAGLLISNQDVLRKAVTGTPPAHFQDADIKISNFQEQMLKSYENLKAELEIQKHKLQDLTNQIDVLTKNQTEILNKKTPEEKK